MGQDEVLKFLARHKGWFTSVQICNGIGGQLSSVGHCLRVLRATGELFYKPDPKWSQRMLYKGK